MTRRGRTAIEAEALTEGGADHVAVSAAGQGFAVPIERIQDVFVAGALTRLPLAPPEVAGLLNLRGRVVTALCLRRLLGLSGASPVGPAMALGVEHRGESYGILVDEVGEVIRLEDGSLDANPTQLDARWIEHSRGIHRRANELLVVLDMDSLLAAESRSPSDEDT